MKRNFLIGDGCVLQCERYSLVKSCREVQLSHKEAEVLKILCTNSLSVVERGEFLESVWGGSESGDIGLNKSILMLRRKFESLGITKSIQTVPRIGYMLLLESKEEIAEDILKKDLVREGEKTEGVKRNSVFQRKLSVIEGTNSIVKLVNNRRFIWSAAMAFTLLALSCYLFIQPPMENKWPLINDVIRYKGTFGTVFIDKDMKSIEPSNIIKELDEIYNRISGHGIYYILVSKINVSLVSISSDGISKSIVFPHTSLSNGLKEELLCAVSNLEKGFLSTCQDSDYLLD